MKKRHDLTEHWPGILSCTNQSPVLQPEKEREKDTHTQGPERHLKGRDKGKLNLFLEFEDVSALILKASSVLN